MKKIFANIVIGSDTINDILLYNFGVEKGYIIDGLPLANTKNHYSSLNSTKSVLKTDSVILLNGVKRKRIYFDNDDTWIEGIGSVQGFFTPAYPIPTGYSYNYLSCFKHNNVELYHNERCQENCCELLTGLTILNIVTRNSVLFPTTTRDYSYITIDKFATLIKIKDVYGKCLKTIENQNASKYSLDFANYSTGIYFVLVHFADKYEVHKMIRY